jgi:hypothetical protein
VQEDIKNESQTVGKTDLRQMQNNKKRRQNNGYLQQISQTQTKTGIKELIK